MSDTLVQKKLAKVESEFARIQEEIASIQEKVNEGNKLIGLRKDELMRFQGEFRLLNELSGDQPSEVVETPKKKK